MSRVDKMDPCPICLDEEFEPVVLQCEHRVCTTCWKDVDTKLCPLCRAKHDPNNSRCPCFLCNFYRGPVRLCSPVDLAARSGNVHDFIHVVSTLRVMTLRTVNCAMWSRDMDTLRYAVRKLPHTNMITYGTLFDSLFVGKWAITKYVWRSKLWGVTK